MELLEIIVDRAWLEELGHWGQVFTGYHQTLAPPFPWVDMVRTGIFVFFCFFGVFFAFFCWQSQPLSLVQVFTMKSSYVTLSGWIKFLSASCYLSGKSYFYTSVFTFESNITGRFVQKLCQFLCFPVYLPFLEIFQSGCGLTLFSSILWLQLRGSHGLVGQTYGNILLQPCSLCLLGKSFLWNVLNSFALLPALTFLFYPLKI